MKKKEKEKIQKVTEFLNTPGHVCFSSIIGFILWWFKSFSVDPIVLLNARCWGWGLVFAVQTQSSGSRSLQRIDSLSGLSASGLGLLFRFWNWSRHLWTKTKQFAYTAGLNLRRVERGTPTWQETHIWTRFLSLMSDSIMPSTGCILFHSFLKKTELKPQGSFLYSFLCLMKIHLSTEQSSSYT